MSLPETGQRPPRRRRALAAAVVLVVVAGVGTALGAALGVGVLRDDSERSEPPALAVPSAYRQPIVEAARSCPALTPARLAGQLMVESRFAADGTNDRAGRGLAGLTDDVWRDWQPWRGADRLDPGANVLALAHYLCHLVGQLRVAGAPNDRWPLAVAAYHAGLAAVRAVERVPDESRDYVDRVREYATWYARDTTLHDRSPGRTAGSAPRGAAWTPSTQGRRDSQIIPERSA